MIDFLLGVPGKLKTIADYLSTHMASARMAKLDLLTVAPAPASTAVSNAVYTSGLATTLGNTIQTSVLNSSIQSGGQGSIAGTAGYGGYYTDFAISSVNTAKSLVLLTGGDPGLVVFLASSTVVRAVWFTYGSSSCRWQVVEFK